MKRALFISLIASVLAIISCKKDSHPNPEPQPSHEETSTAIGTPSGQLTSKVIDVNGGEVNSADGRMRVIFPAGAVDAAVTVGIQPITNELPQGIGVAYRLTPHGQQFNKPVQVILNYAPMDTIDTRAEFLDIAYQDELGTWQMLTNTVVNRSQKQLMATTNHFSDWGYFKSIKLTPAAATVEQGAFLELKLTTTFPYVDPDDAPPGTYTIKVLKTPRKLRPDEVKGWSYAGEGSFEGDGPQGFYTAPDHEPSRNPEAVTANISMHRKGQFMLVSNITVLGDHAVDYLMVDEDYMSPLNQGMCRLYLYGSFGADPGITKRSVKINGVNVEVDLWSPSVIRCKIDQQIFGAIEIAANGRVVARSVLRKFKGSFIYERFHGGLANSGSTNALKETAEFQLVYRGFGKPCPANVSQLFPIEGALAEGTESKYTLAGSASVSTPPVDGCISTTSVSLPTTTGYYFIEPHSMPGNLTGLRGKAKDIVGGVEVELFYVLEDIITGVRVKRSSSCGASSLDPARSLGVSLEGFNNQPIQLEYWGTDELKLKGTNELRSNRMSSGILIEAWDGTGNPSHYETDGLMPATFRDNP